MRWLVILATAGILAVNGLANGLPINGKTTGDISDGFDILFTPAGYVFSIWGLIYTMLIVFSVVQALPSRQSSQVEKARPWYLLNAAGNMSWIFAWHYELFPLSLVLMLVILGSLIAIERAVRGVEGRFERAFVRAPFSLYLGWISVATIANVTVVLWEAGATGLLSSPGFTLGLMVGATGICAAVSVRLADPVYAGVFVWALVGIGVANGETSLLLWGALVLVGVCAVTGVLALRRG